MRFWENTLLAIAGLKSSKMRSLLTMLGIIIGIGAVIAIVTVGNALTTAVTQSWGDMGLTNINVGLYERNSDEVAEEDRFNEEMFEKLLKAYPRELEAISLSYGAEGGEVKDGRKYANVFINGINGGYALANNMKIEKGRIFSERELRGAKNVAIVSDKLVASIFPKGVSPLGKEIKFHGQEGIETFAIVGVYPYEPSPFEMVNVAEKDVATNMFVPINTAKRMTGAAGGYTWITAVARNGVDMDEATLKVEQWFQKEYARKTRYGIYAYNNASMVQEVTNIMSGLSVTIGITAAISLLVGGIGVMNIMLVSVTERTREIGTRKALGARSSAIRAQFIVESMIICLIGGMIGIVTGLALGSVGTSILISALGGPDIGLILPPATVIAFAVLFSMAIGVFFGYYPANKAAKLDPIEALRYE